MQRIQFIRQMICVYHFLAIPSLIFFFIFVFKNQNSVDQFLLLNDEAATDAITHALNILDTHRMPPRSAPLTATQF